jgi:hypothetical protein
VILVQRNIFSARRDRIAQVTLTLPEEWDEKDWWIKAFGDAALAVVELSERHRRAVPGVSAALPR